MDSHEADCEHDSESSFQVKAADFIQTAVAWLSTELQKIGTWHTVLGKTACEVSKYLHWEKLHQNTLNTWLNMQEGFMQILMWISVLFT